MTSKELNKIFDNYAEDARFRSWSKGEAPGMKSVYACEYGTIWKFTPKEWWKCVTRVVRNNGGHDFLLSAALRSRPKHIVKGEGNKFYSTDSRVRCVNPLDWTLLDWTNELLPGGTAIHSVEHATANPRKPNLSAITQKAAAKSA